MILDIILTFFLVFLNGFFVAAEFAIVKVRSSQLELRIREGSKTAKVARSLIQNLDAYLSATQLGITLASLGLGWIGESVVAKLIIDAIALLGFEMPHELAHQIALPIAFLTITVLHIVFGELAPKSLAIQRSESVSMIIAIPLKLFYQIFRPFIWLLNGFANRFIILIGFEPPREGHSDHSEEELRVLLEESSKTGVIEQAEHEMLENIFDFAETPIKQIMVPRGKISAVDIRMNHGELIEKVIEEGYSRYPVFDESIDDIIGVVYVKDILTMLNHRNLIVFSDLIRPSLSVHEDELIDQLLRRMQLQKVHMAIVIDDFGGTAGIVTLEDIIEEIVGEIQDEYDEETPFVVKLTETDYEVDALTAIDDANDTLPKPLPDNDGYETVGGLVLTKLGRIPDLNEIVELDDYNCKITQCSNRQIEKVELSLKENRDNPIA
jgi:CBS domain containing-hemolysin-like protein